MTLKPIASSDTVPEHVVRGLLGGLGLVFLLSGVFFWWTFFFSALVSSMTSADWLEVDCEVIGSRIRREREGKTYPEIQFRYRFANQEHDSNRFDFTTLNRSSRRCEEIVGDHPVGLQTRCFVDPDDVTVAVINRGYDFSLFAFLFPPVFIVVGAAVVAVATTKDRFEKKVGFIRTRASEVQTKGETGVAYSIKDKERQHPGDLLDQEYDQPQQLSPDRQRLARVIVLVVLSVFWNSVVGVIVSMAIKAMASEFSPVVPLVLMAVLFGAIGLWILTAAVRCFLGLFNPVVSLNLKTGAVERGVPVQVSWQCGGNLARMKSLRIAVHGQESVRYSKGRTAYCEFRELVNLTVLDSSKRNAIGKGKGSFTIPTDAMHSFAAGGYEINWKVCVHAEIAWGPDIDEDYAIRVKP